MAVIRAKGRDGVLGIQFPCQWGRDSLGRWASEMLPAVPTVNTAHTPRDSRLWFPPPKDLGAGITPHHFRDGEIKPPVPLNSNRNNNNNNNGSRHLLAAC